MLWGITYFFISHFIIEFYYCLLKNLHIGLVTQIGNKATLFGTQQITCTTDVKVLHSDVDTTAQIAKILQSL